MKVSWQPLEKSCIIPITGYIIEYFKVGPQDTVKDIKNVTVTNGTTYTISGLIPCAKYSVQVAAINSKGTGPFSEPVIEILEDGKLNFYNIILMKIIYLHIVATCICRLSVCCVPGHVAYYF